MTKQIPKDEPKLSVDFPTRGVSYAVISMLWGFNPAAMRVSRAQIHEAMHKPLIKNNIRLVEDYVFERVLKDLARSNSSESEMAYRDALNRYLDIPKERRDPQHIADYIDGICDVGSFDVDAPDYESKQDSAYRPFSFNNNPDNFTPGRYIANVHAEGEMAQNVAVDAGLSRGLTTPGDHKASLSNFLIRKGCQT